FGGGRRVGDRGRARVGLGRPRGGGVFGKAARRKILCGAGGWGERRAARRFRAAARPRQISGNFSARECLLEIWCVSNWIVKQHRNSVEANSTARLVENPASDFHALVGFSRR